MSPYPHHIVGDGLPCHRQGKSITDLLADLKEQERQKRLLQRKEESTKAPEVGPKSPASTSPSSASSHATSPSSTSSSRKDSSPVKVCNYRSGQVIPMANTVLATVKHTEPRQVAGNAAHPRADITTMESLPRVSLRRNWARVPLRDCPRRKLREDARRRIQVPNLRPSCPARERTGRGRDKGARLRVLPDGVGLPWPSAGTHQCARPFFCSESLLKSADVHDPLHSASGIQTTAIVRHPLSRIDTLHGPGQVPWTRFASRGDHAVRGVQRCGSKR